MPVFDSETMLREALWMIPLLIFIVVMLVAAVIGISGWVIRTAVRIGAQFRLDVLARLEAQDEELAEARKDRAEDRKIMVDIKELLKDEVHRLRGLFWKHDLRITRLEEHNKLPPMRRYDDQETGD